MRVTRTPGGGACGGEADRASRRFIPLVPRVAAAVVILVALGAPSTARAGDKKHNDKARAHFETGTAYFRLEKYP